MCAAIGIKSQPSRFAVLMKDSDSDDEETEVTKKNTAKSAATRGDTKAAVMKSKKNETALKNAKKRARRKKNQSKASHDQQEPIGTADDTEWQDISEQVADNAFEQDLQEALMMSKLEMEQRAIIESENHFKETTKKSASKKGVKLTLQELHSGGLEKSLSSPTAAETPPPPPNDKNFFEDLSAAVDKELQKEKSKKKSVSSSEQLGNSESSLANAPRVADLQFQLEKRDSTIIELEATIDRLNKELGEVKKRNQGLCMILSKGEFCTKTELLEQVEQLTNVKDELTTEVTELHKSLEQEKSKNKHLRLELAKFQGNRNKTASTSSAT